MDTQAGWKIVKEDERYVVSDNCSLKKISYKHYYP